MRTQDGSCVLQDIPNGNFVVTDATVEIGEHGGSLVSDDGGFKVGAGEVADGFEGTPSGFDLDLDFPFEAAKGNGGSEVSRDAAELGQNIFGKVLEIFRQLHLSGASGPATEDGSRCGGWGIRGRGESGIFVANDDVPGPNFPFFCEAV